jgi:dTDP-4-dehydrorhamnose reductase
MANQLFSPTAVDDVAHAILLGCRQGLSGLYNLAASEVFTRDDLARRYCDILGVTAKIVSRTQAEIGFAELRPEKSHLNGARFTAATGMHCVPMRQVIGRFRGKLELDGSKG